ncbi:hypothetical protein IV203_028406 [Nitzschia inconspicua]|nr:hypothetical protein IV203_028406 [Nitzschia inconspicua]
MRSKDYSDGLPFLITPGRDQDIDYDSVEMDRFGAIMDLFVRLPFEQDIHFFDTKAEYYSFYKWEFHGTFQDEFYFPSWYYHTERADQMADFRAKRTKVSGDHLALQDPYSDKTLGDRCFYGAGQRFLTPIKLPGIDEDYEYIFPSGPWSYLSQEHRDTEFFRYPHKPRSKDLMRMIDNFWPKEAKRNRRHKDNLVPLARYKHRIAEIDFAIFASLPAREPFEAPGEILYLDPKSKLPMGIWKSSTREMILPNEPKWEHAKFYYRVTERAAVATQHVAESHFGWSQSVATAAWQCFHQDHPMRSLLKPFTLNVHSVNSAAYHMLVREAGILTHGNSLTTEGVIGSMTTVWAHFNFSQTIPELFDSRKLDLVMDTNELPLFSQAKRLNTVHHRFVKRFVDQWYPTDDDLLNDPSVVRFWHHVNTYGRHIDPCVCGLPSDLFFDDNNVWPGFETTRTCKDLLDTVGFESSKNEYTRRRDWCTNTDRYQKAQAVAKMDQIACDANPKCKKLWWAPDSLKPDMELPELRSKSQFVNFLSTFVWHVTAGHKLNSDNIHAFSDAEYSGVRMPKVGPDGNLPTISEVGSYVFGSAVGLLTSVRCPPLMADWMPLYSHLVARQSGMSLEEKEKMLQSLEDIHKEYKFALLDLSVDFLDESASRPNNRQSNTMNPATHASSVSV